MGITVFLGLLGGLALFLYGMQMMSDALEEAAGNRMKQILEKLTANRFMGVLVGAVITAVVQSSSATTVMVVGFVNSGLMTLRQAVWIIMGANVGTTITGQLIALDVGMLAPLFAFIGVAITSFIKNKKLHPYGMIMAGLGVLFIGMDMMSSAMTPLRESEMFIEMMTSFANPILGILAGAAFTAVIQSSAATIGILQALAASGVIGFESVVFVLFGSNIGTCITAVLAALGANRGAKRTTIIHLLFNVIGTVVFTLVFANTNLASVVAGWTPGAPASQIANMHTLFNISTTILLLPFGNYLADIAMKIMPDRPQDAIAHASPLTALAQTEEFRRHRFAVGSAAVYTEALHHELDRMLKMAGENCELCYQLVLDNDLEGLKKAEGVEDTLDDLNKEISQYVSKMLVHNNGGANVAAIEEYFLITGNVERIGDHAMNIGGYVEVINRKSIKFSEMAREEIKQMQEVVKTAIDTVRHQGADTTEWLTSVAALEQQIDDMTVSYRESHLNRMREGKCSEEACVLYSEMLTDFERIGDHVLNIAQAYAKISLAE